MKIKAREPVDERGPSQCYACGGFALSDDDNLCGCCQDRGAGLRHGWAVHRDHSVWHQERDHALNELRETEREERERFAALSPFAQLVEVCERENRSGDWKSSMSRAWLEVECAALDAPFAMPF